MRGTVRKGQDGGLDHHASGAQAGRSPRAAVREDCLATTPPIRTLVRGLQALHNVGLTGHWCRHSSGKGHEILTVPREPEAILGPLNLDEDTLADLRLTIGRRLTPKPVKVRADVEVKCFAYEGIEAIKKALAAGEACSTEEVPIKIRLVAPPLYVMSTTSTDKNAAIEVMEKAVERIGEVISEGKGDMVVKMSVGCDLLVSPRRVCTDARIAQGGVGDGRRGAQGSHGPVRKGQHGRGGRRRLGRGRRVGRRRQRDERVRRTQRVREGQHSCHAHSIIIPTRGPSVRGTEPYQSGVRGVPLPFLPSRPGIKNPEIAHRDLLATVKAASPGD